MLCGAAWTAAYAAWKRRNGQTCEASRARSHGAWTGWSLGWSGGTPCSSSSVRLPQQQRCAPKSSLSAKCLCHHTDCATMELGK